MIATADGPCELCGFDGPKIPLYPRQAIVRCPRCGLTFWHGRVPDVQELYTPDYFHGGEYQDYLNDKTSIQLNFKRRLHALQNAQPRGELLEIGCAYGFFLELARKHYTVKGIDVAPQAVSFAHDQLGLDVECIDFLSMKETGLRYDVICMWDTIEHLAQPVRFIEKASRWLKPGGILAMSTGDIGSLTARWRGERWRLIHPPTHLFYFSKDTLNQATERAGLITIQNTCIGYWRSWAAIMHGIFLLGPRPKERWYRWLTGKGRFNFPLYINLFDIRMVTARKPGVPRE